MAQASPALTPVETPAIVTRVDAHEGPVYVAEEDALYVTTVPRPGPSGPLVAIKRIAVGTGHVSVVREDANAANGMALDSDGHLLVCEQGGRSRRAAIARVDRLSGRRLETVVDECGGLPLNSPNDVVVARDGAIWFTDPSYGFLQGFRPRPSVGERVYRYDPSTGALAVAADGFDKPNGLAFGPDGSVLYVGDSGANHEPGSYDPARPHHVKAFDVVGGRRLRGERVFAEIEPGFPDGIKVDADGRVYVSCAAGIQVFSRDGELDGEIALPGAVNFCFGGPRRNHLFITSDTAVHRAVLAATGPPPPSQKGA